ncbi:MAG: hypothetical protein E6G51_06655 [Actinobacteria bacterium]|nr:MAG: hypothetical protein E6G51_06655 [Actinomycetota bacterium]
MSTAGRSISSRWLFASLLLSLALLFPGVEAHAASPANDTFAAATGLAGTFHDASPGSTVEATKEEGEPDHAESLATHTVWYSWTPTESGPVGVKVRSCLGQTFEPVIAVYTGAAVNALTPVADNAPWFSSGCIFSEPGLAEFEAMAGITYRIAVAGADETSGTFELEFEAAPANDDFANAKIVEAQLPQTLTSTNVVSTKEPEEPDHAGDPGGHSVWFEWTPTVSEPVDVSTCAQFGRIDAVLAVYTGSSLGSLTEIASNDDGPEAVSNFECLGNDSGVSFEAETGTTYRIAVDGAGGTVGRFNLRIRGRPENDDFASPQVLPPNVQVFTNKLTNKGATKEPEEPDHAGDPGGHSVWFEWTPPASGRYGISTECGDGNLDSLLAVYTGSAVGGLTEIAGNDDSPSACKNTASQLEFEATASTSYRIAVDGKAGSTGSFAVKIDPAPENDAFAAADDLSPELPTDNLNWTRGASKEVGEPEHAGEPGGHSVWYSWTPRARHPPRRLHRLLSRRADRSREQRRLAALLPLFRQRGRDRSQSRHHLPDRRRLQGRGKAGPLHARTIGAARQRRLRRGAGSRGLGPLWHDRVRNQRAGRARTRWSAGRPFGLVRMDRPDESDRDRQGMRCWG